MNNFPIGEPPSKGPVLGTIIIVLLIIIGGIYIITSRRDSELPPPPVIPIDDFVEEPNPASPPSLEVEFNASGTESQDL